MTQSDRAALRHYIAIALQGAGLSGLKETYDQAEAVVAAWEDEVAMGEHTTKTDICWCQPRIEEVPPNGRVIVHKRTADGYEPPARPVPAVRAGLDRRGGWPFGR